MLVSVIVPVYNAEKYLHRCIDSILAQTFTDFELLLVNDGSKDNSGKICDEYAAKDNRVRVFHKENGGVSSARNLGLDNAKGEWITFVDSDDWIERQSLEYLIRYGDADVVIGKMLLESNGAIISFPVLGSFKDDVLFKYIAANIDNSSICGPCCKLFKHSIIQRGALRFNERLCFGEDSIFVKNYLLSTSRIMFIDALLYHYNDIGCEIYNKYSKSFLPIINYYYEMLKIYDKFECFKSLLISRNGLVGIVYDMAINCLVKNGMNDILYVSEFLKEQFAREELGKRKSVNIKIQLWLARFPKGYLLLFYVKTVNKLKALMSKL